MSRPRLFGTLFYSNYLIRALALHQSFERHFPRDCTLVMLAMDEEARRMLERLRLSRVRILPIEELEAKDAALNSVKVARGMAEYAWTAAPALMRALMSEVAAGEAIAYLDADLMFFSDPQPMFEDWGANDIAIHEHRFAPAHLPMQRNSGIFNVGFVGFRNAEQGRRCLERWYAQCIETCRLDPERGFYGDQKYLEEWPALYDRLAILKHKGVGVAPWNVEQYRLSEADGCPHVDGEPVVFYHFHAMRMLVDDLCGHIVLKPSYGYRFSPEEIRLIYRPYAAALHAAYRAVRRVDAQAPLARAHSSFAGLAQIVQQPGLVSSSRPVDLLFRQIDALNRGRKLLLRPRTRLQSTSAPSR